MKKKKIVLIPSSLKKILIGKKIDLFVNLVSFQEDIKRLITISKLLKKISLCFGM